MIHQGMRRERLVQLDMLDEIGPIVHTSQEAGPSIPRDQLPGPDTGAIPKVRPNAMTNPRSQGLARTTRSGVHEQGVANVHATLPEGKIHFQNKFSTYLR